MKTDQDELTAGEKRLLKSIVKTIVGSRGSSMINAANRALETARKKVARIENEVEQWLTDEEMERDLHYTEEERKDIQKRKTAQKLV